VPFHRSARAQISVFVKYTPTAMQADRDAQETS
jgi:hypothetical protein